MLTKDFDVTDTVRYMAKTPCQFNGVQGRFWERRVLRQGCWVLDGTEFHPLRATKKDINHA